MISLPVFNKQDVRFREFGSARMPLRPSALGDLVKCPMSVFLSYCPGDDLGNAAAQTGNLVHAAAAEYHRKAGDVGAGAEALEAAREKFPDGDPVRARRIYRSYVEDPENQGADVPWVEQAVRLVLPCEIGEPIVIEGTLDQVRRKQGRLSVWDIKTGARMTGEETVEEHTFQQAAYTLAARECLDPEIVCGGIIYTAGYEKPLAKRHLPLKLSIDQCTMLMLEVVAAVATVRRGQPAFRPSESACKYCPVRPYTHCLSMFKGAYR